MKSAKKLGRARPLLKRPQTPQSKEEAAVACAPVQMTAVSFLYFSLAPFYAPSVITAAYQRTRTKPPYAFISN